jgi:small conductance mechanosensitive channel
VAELADSSVNLAIRPWCASADYWGLLFDTTEAVKAAFDANGVSIPFPQRDVHLYQKPAA